MNLFLLPLHLQMQAYGMAFKATSSLFQAQARMFRLAVPGAMLPVTLRAGCGGISRG